MRPRHDDVSVGKNLPQLMGCFMRSSRFQILWFGITSVALFVGAERSSNADLIMNLSTGLDSSGNVLTSGGLSDAHWTVSEQAGGFGAAQTVFPGNADSGFPSWVANNASSDWIARNANNAHNGTAPYTFSTTFSLSGDTLSTVSLAGSWAIDDTGTLNLNGTLIGSLNSGWTSLTPVTVAAGSNLFVQGTNTLSITITSTDNNIEGVRFQGSVNGSPLVGAPEPSTMVMAGFGSILGLGAWLRRRMNWISGSLGA